MKNFRPIMTSGVDALRLDFMTMKDITKTTAGIYRENADNYFVSFERNKEASENRFIVTDGNDNVIRNPLTLNIPKGTDTIWAIVDEYPDSYVLTVLLPEEY